MPIGLVLPIGTSVEMCLNTLIHKALKVLDSYLSNCREIKKPLYIKGYFSTLKGYLIRKTSQGGLSYERHPVKKMADYHQ